MLLDQQQRAASVLEEIQRDGPVAQLGLHMLDTSSRQLSSHCSWRVAGSVPPRPASRSKIKLLDG